MLEATIEAVLGASERRFGPFRDSNVRSARIALPSIVTKKRRGTDGGSYAQSASYESHPFREFRGANFISLRDSLSDFSPDTLLHAVSVTGTNQGHLYLLRATVGPYPATGTTPITPLK